MKLIDSWRLSTNHHPWSWSVSSVLKRIWVVYLWVCHKVCHKHLIDKGKKERNIKQIKYLSHSNDLPCTRHYVVLYSIIYFFPIFLSSKRRKIYKCKKWVRLMSITLVLIFEQQGTITPSSIVQKGISYVYCSICWFKKIQLQWESFI